MPNCCCKPKMTCCCCQPQPETMYVPVQVSPANTGCSGKSGCSFSCLIILILILLVFSNYGKRGIGPEDGGEGESFLGGKGIIFIIALFYLSCVSPCGCNC